MLLNCLEINPKKRCNALELLQYLKPDFDATQITAMKKVQEQTTLRNSRESSPDVIQNCGLKRK